MKKIVAIITLTLLTGFSLLSGSVNRSIRVERGEKIGHSLKTVNGSIRIADQAEITGDCSTVNGSVTLGSRVLLDGDCSTVNGSIVIDGNCRIENVRTVNGRIEIGEKCDIHGDVRTTNGRLSLQEGTVVTGSLTTTNGNVELNGVDLKEDLRMSNGEVNIDRKSRVGGDIVISPSRSSGSWFFGLFRREGPNNKPIEVFIRNHSIVEGNIIVKNDYRKVIVYLDENSEVKGKIINAEKHSL